MKLNNFIVESNVPELKAPFNIDYVAYELRPSNVRTFRLTYISS